MDLKTDPIKAIDSDEQLDELLVSLQATLLPVWSQIHDLAEAPLSSDIVAQLKRMEHHTSSLLVGILEITAIRLVEEKRAEKTTNGQEPTQAPS